MNDGQIHQISEQIGGLKASVELMTDLWKSQEVSASAGRRALHDKFESLQRDVERQISGLSKRLDDFAGEMKTMGKQMGSIEPSVKIFTDEKLRNEGAQRLGVRLWGAMLLVAGAFGWGINEFLTWYRHH